MRLVIAAGLAPLGLLLASLSLEAHVHVAAAEHGLLRSATAAQVDEPSEVSKLSKRSWPEAAW